jgi:hypothetical protein
MGLHRKQNLDWTSKHGYQIRLLQQHLEETLLVEEDSWIESSDPPKMQLCITNIEIELLATEVWTFKRLMNSMVTYLTQALAPH